MSLLSRLFGRSTTAGDEPAEATETYEGFAINPAPIAEGGTYRVAATIEKDGRSHRLIRADTMNSRDECVATSILKAKQMIDEQGDRLFG